MLPARIDILRCEAFVTVEAHMRNALEISRTRYQGFVDWTLLLVPLGGEGRRGEGWCGEGGSGEGWHLGRASSCPVLLGWSNGEHDISGHE